MSDFKEGDRVWWFEFPEQCIGKNEDIAICSNEVIAIANVPMVFENGECFIFKNGSISRALVDIYKSRAEAFEGLIKYLERLRDTYE